MRSLFWILLLEVGLCLILQEINLLKVESAPQPMLNSCNDNYIRQQSIAQECRNMYRRSSQLSSLTKSIYQIVQAQDIFQDIEPDEHVLAQILGLHPPHYNSHINSYPIDPYPFNNEFNYARYKPYDENKINVDKMLPSVFQFWPNADTNNRKFKRNVELLLDKCCSGTGCTEKDFNEKCSFRRWALIK